MVRVRIMSDEGTGKQRYAQERWKDTVTGEAQRHHLTYQEYCRHSDALAAAAYSKSLRR